jgi:FtsZ-binding cell division protein ZapB
MEEYIAKINQFREKNKNDQDYFKKLEIFENNIKKKLIEDLKKLDTGEEYIETLKEKLADEYKKFQFENAKLFENQVNEVLEKNIKTMYDDFETDKYSKNYYQFFIDIENFKDSIENSAPDFPRKKEIITDKILTVVKKFIESTFLKNKVTNEKEILTLRNDYSQLLNKYNIKNEEYENLRNDNTQIIEKLNTQILEFKLSSKSNDERFRETEKDKRQIETNYEKMILTIKKEYETKMDKMKQENIELSTEVRNKESMLDNLKFNNEKSLALSEQKVTFMQNEVNNLKERNEALKNELNDAKNANEELKDDFKLEMNKKRALELEIEKLKKENNSPEKANRMDKRDNEVVSLLKSQIESSKEANKMYEEMINSLRRSSANDDLKDIIESNKVIQLNPRVWH